MSECESCVFLCECVSPCFACVRRRGVLRVPAVPSKARLRREATNVLSEALPPFLVDSPPITHAPVAVELNSKMRLLSLYSKPTYTTLDLPLALDALTPSLVSVCFHTPLRPPPLGAFKPTHDER